MIVEGSNFKFTFTVPVITWEDVLLYIQQNSEELRATVAKELDNYKQEETDE